MPILVSNQTPVNLLGRDALCKMGLQIWCSPDGVYIDTMGIVTQMMVLEPKADVRKTINKWGKFSEAQIPETQFKRSELHCAMIYDLERDEKIKKKLDKT